MASGLKVGDVYLAVSLQDQGLTAGLATVRTQAQNTDKAVTTAGRSISTSVSGAGRSASQAAGVWVDANGRMRNANGQFVSSTKTVGTAATTMASQTSSAGRSIGSVFGGMLRNAASTASGLAGYYGVMSIASWVSGVVKAGIDYRDTMNTLQAVSGATAGQMKSLSNEAIQLGNDITLPNTSASDAANAMTELSKAGLSVKDTMGAAHGTLELATAGNLDVSQSATDVANALLTFKLRGSDANVVADQLAAAANISSGEVQDFADALHYAGGSAAALHIPIADVNTMLAEMANQGLTGTRAGTSLNDVFTRLASPTQQAATAMQQYGVSAFNANGQLKPMPQVIDQFNGALGKMTPQAQQAFLNLVFGTQGARAANVVFGQSVGVFNQTEAAVTKVGAAHQLAAAKSQGLGGEMRSIGNTIQTDTLQAYLAVEPEMTKIATIGANQLGPALGTVGKGFSAFGGFVSTLQKMGVLVPLLGTVAGLLSLWGATLLVNSIRLGVLSGLETANSIAMAAQAVAAGGMTAAEAAMTVGGFAAAAAELAMLWPIALIVLGIAALITVVVLLVTHWKQVTTVLGIAWTAMKGWAGWLGGEFLSVWGSITGAVGGFFSTVGTDVSGFFGRVLGFFQSGVAAIQAFLNIWWVHDLLTIIELPFALGWLAIQTVWGLIQTGVQAGVGLVTGIVSGGWSLLTGITSAAWTLISGFVIGQATALWTSLSLIWGFITGAATGAWTFLWTQATLVWSLISGAVSGPINGLWLWLQLIWGLVTGFLVGQWTALWSSATYWWGLLQGAITGPISAVRSTLQGIWSGITGDASGAWNGLKGTVGGAINGIVGVINGFVGAINKAGIPGIHLTPVPKFATGGIVPGRGSGDTVPAMLTPGEVVLRRSAVAALGGPQAANGLNRGQGLGAGLGDISGMVGQIGGQCLAWVNKILGSSSPFLGVPAAKDIAPDINSHTASAGEVFVMTNPPYGHTGFVTGPASGNQVPVIDSNWALDERIRQHTISAGSIAGYISLGGSTPVIGGLVDFVSSVTSAVNDALNAAAGLTGWPGADTARGLINMAADPLKSLAQSAMQAASNAWNAASTGISNIATSAQVAGWITAGLTAAGKPLSWLPQMETIAHYESSGNPNANQGLSGSANALGLFQTIQATFNAYVPALLRALGVFNPIADTAAAANYIASRYGDPGHTPGLISLSSGGPYRGYATGGIAATPQLAMLAENGPEVIVPLRNLGSGNGGGDNSTVVDAIERLTETVANKVLGKLTIQTEQPVDLQKLDYQLAMNGRGGAQI